MLAGGPAAVAVTLVELRPGGVPDNAPLRLDALVVTGPQAGGAGLTIGAYTSRGGPAFGDLPLFRGPVHEVLDIAIWVSPDHSRAPDLAALLAARAGPRTAQEAVDLAHQVLVNGVGVYRTSLLAGEGFGIGERWAGGLGTGPGVSVCYRVEAI